MAPFDMYSWRARIQPGLLCALPAAMTGGILLGFRRDWNSGLIGFGCGEVVLFFVAQMIRDRGRRVESALWQSWGGAPTTLIMQGADSVDMMQRNREFLHGFLPGAADGAEEHPSIESIEVYVRMLREKTRDRAQFPLVSAENAGYGFRRNCYGIRGMGIAMASIAGLSAFGAGLAGLIEGHRHLAEVGGITFIIDLLATLIWTLVVTPEWVKVQGFNYAKALLGAAEVVLTSAK